MTFCSGMIVGHGFPIGLTVRCTHARVNKFLAILPSLTIQMWALLLSCMTFLLCPTTTNFVTLDQWPIQLRLEHQLVQVELVLRDGSPALVGNYLVACPKRPCSLPRNISFLMVVNAFHFCHLEMFSVWLMPLFSKSRSVPSRTMS